MRDPYFGRARRVDSAELCHSRTVISRSVSERVKNVDPAERTDIAVTRLQVVAQEPGYHTEQEAADAAVRAIIDRIRQEAEMLPRIARIRRLKGFDNGSRDGGYSVRERVDGQDFSVPAIVGEERIGSTTSNDSVSYLRRLEVRVYPTQLASGEWAYHAEATADWIHDTGRRFSPDVDRSFEWAP